MSTMRSRPASSRSERPASSSPRVMRVAASRIHTLESTSTGSPVRHTVNPPGSSSATGGTEKDSDSWVFGERPQARRVDRALKRRLVLDGDDAPTFPRTPRQRSARRGGSGARPSRRWARPCAAGAQVRPPTVGQRARRSSRRLAVVVEENLLERRFVHRQRRHIRRRQRPQGRRRRCRTG